MPVYFIEYKDILGEIFNDFSNYKEGMAYAYSKCRISYLDHENEY